jgi:hypothetical protein
MTHNSGVMRKSQLSAAAEAAIIMLKVLGAIAQI